MKSFDLEHVYDEQIDPLVREIMRICQRHHIPAVMSFLYRSNEAGGMCAWAATAPQIRGAGRRGGPA